MGRFGWLPGLILAVCATGGLALGVRVLDGSAQVPPAIRDRAVIPSIGGGSGLDLAFPANPACLRVENLGPTAGGLFRFGESPFALTGTGSAAQDFSVFALETRQDGFRRLTAIGEPSVALSAANAGFNAPMTVLLPAQLLDGDLFSHDFAATSSAATLELCGRPTPEPSLAACTVAWFDVATGQGQVTCSSGERWGGAMAQSWRLSDRGGLVPAGVHALGRAGVINGGSSLITATPDPDGSTPLVALSGRPTEQTITVPTVEIITTQPVSVERTRLLGKMCATDQGVWDAMVQVTFDVGPTAEFRVLKLIPPHECRHFVAEVGLAQAARVTARVVTWNPWTAAPASGLIAGPWVYAVDHDAKTGAFRRNIYNVSASPVDVTKVSADLWILDPQGRPLAYLTATALSGVIPVGGSVEVTWGATSIRPALASASDLTAEGVVDLVRNQLRAPGVGGVVTGFVINP